MPIEVGSVINMTIVKEMGYAVWGVAQGKIGFIHISEFSDERPIPDEVIPHMGDRVHARVFYVPESPVVNEPADVTCGGTISVDFAATMRGINQDYGGTRPTPSSR